jgi:hypothetical protein
LGLCGLGLFQGYPLGLAPIPLVIGPGQANAAVRGAFGAGRCLRRRCRLLGLQRLDAVLDLLDRRGTLGSGDERLMV